jgi:putative PIN family toxin of toxin-antitoxin system
LRAVVDNNIWISALLNPGGFPGQVLAAYRQGRFSLVTSEPVLTELETVLGRTKFRRRGVTAESITELLFLLRSTADLIEVAGTLRVCRDAKDDMLIETGLEGAADVIVSRDEDLTRALEVADYLAPWGVRVVTVRRFLEALAQP